MKLVLSIESWLFTFFQFLLLLMVLHDVIFNVTKVLRYECEGLEFLQKVYKFHVLEFLVKTPLERKFYLTCTYKFKVEI